MKQYKSTCNASLPVLEAMFKKYFLNWSRSWLQAAANGQKIIFEYKPRPLLARLRAWCVIIWALERKGMLAASKNG